MKFIVEAQGPTGGWVPANVALAHCKVHENGDEDVASFAQEEHAYESEEEAKQAADRIAYELACPADEVRIRPLSK